VTRSGSTRVRHSKINAPLGGGVATKRGHERRIFPPVIRPSILLYDGDCGFCAGSVQFMLRHERLDQRERLHFAPLQGSLGQAVRAGLGDDQSTLQSVIWVRGTDRSVLTRSDAALEALTHLGGLWMALAACARLVPRTLRDAVYDQIARRRFSLAAPACLVPPADQRARFLS
jgi:predicted DCC family thiol-disulfide oxidoreductase YuxK